MKWQEAACHAAWDWGLPLALHGMAKAMRAFNAWARNIGKNVADDIARSMGKSGDDIARGADDATETVGRWMNPKEYEQMKNTGVLQEGGGGQTRVSYPPSAKTYKGAKKGDIYVEFDVPKERILPHSQGTGRIPGPNSPDARVPGRDPRDYSMPKVTNIKAIEVKE